MNVEDSIANKTGTYRVESSGTQFIVIDPDGEQVGIFPTQDAANETIEFCKKEDRMWDTANLLLEIAIEAHMKINGVDRETSCYWLCSASEVVEKVSLPSTH